MGRISVSLRSLVIAAAIIFVVLVVLPFIVFGIGSGSSGPG
jgi:uncharacterized protein HemY